MFYIRTLQVLVLLVLGTLAVPAAAEEEVDLELVLAVDVSRSMSPRELEIQRRGYAEALVSDEVIRAIQGGLIGKIALRYVEWAGQDLQRVVVEWTVVASRKDAEEIALRLVKKFDPALRRTSISSAITHSHESFDGNGYVSNRRVIDISGDGPNNSGFPVTGARDKAVADGIVINGLPLMTRDGYFTRFHLEDLDEYYRNCVIGGPASFVIPVREWTQFTAAVRQKLVQELAFLPIRKRVAFHEKQATNYDCLIGEKLWQQRFQNWDNN